MTVRKVPFLDLQAKYRNCRTMTLNLGLWTKVVLTPRLSNLTRSQLCTTAASSTCLGASQSSPRCWSGVEVLRGLQGSVLHSGNSRTTNHLLMNFIYRTLAYTRFKLQKCHQKCRLKSKTPSVLLTNKQNKGRNKRLKPKGSFRTPRYLKMTLMMKNLLLIKSLAKFRYRLRTLMIKSLQFWKLKN